MSLDKNEIIDQVNALTVDGDFDQEDLLYLVNWLISNGSMEGAPRDMIQVRRGNKEHLPILAQGELALTLDTEELYIGGTKGNINLMANSWLRDKTVNFIGDSITAEAPGVTTYVTHVAEILKCKTKNYAVGGMSFVGPKGFWTVAPNVDPNADVNVIMGGVNDYLLGVTLGSKDGADSYDYLYPALDKFARNLVARCPHAINVMFTPLKAETRASVANYSQDEVVKAIHYTANKYNFVLVDLYSNAPNMNPNNPTLKARWMMPDGVHPNQDYVDKFLGRIVAENLVSLQTGGTVLLEQRDYVRMVHGSYEILQPNVSANLSLYGDVTSTNNNMIGDREVVIQKTGLYLINAQSQVETENANGNIIVGVALNDQPFLNDIFDLTGLPIEHKTMNLSHVYRLVEGDVLTIKAINNTDKTAKFITNILTAYQLM